MEINCPYWMNKIADGRISLRGFANGKGSAEEIREELIKRAKDQSITFKNGEELRKFARRERIGIDCSGFVFRILGELVRLNYKKTNLDSLDRVFTKGINKTNASTLTDRIYSDKIANISEIQTGDMIRLMNGKHVALVVDSNGNQIIYVHCANMTKIQGVHLGIIETGKSVKSLAECNWQEKTGRGDNYGNKYFRPEKGDGVYRLKVFNNFAI